MILSLPVLLSPAFCLLPSAFHLPPAAYRLLPSAFRLLPSFFSDLMAIRQRPVHRYLVDVFEVRADGHAHGDSSDADSEGFQ